MSTYLYYNSGSNVTLGGDLTLSQVKDALSVATDIENDIEDLQNKIKTLKSKLLEGRSNSGDKEIDLDVSASEAADEFKPKKIVRKKKGGSFGAHPVECTCDNCIKLAEEILGGVNLSYRNTGEYDLPDVEDLEDQQGGDSDDEEPVQDVVGDVVYDPFA